MTDAIKETGDSKERVALDLLKMINGLKREDQDKILNLYQICASVVRGNINPISQVRDRFGRGPE